MLFKYNFGQIIYIGENVFSFTIITVKKGDFVCFFMKKKGSYIYGFSSDDYSEKMIKSVGFGKLLCEKAPQAAGGFESRVLSVFCFESVAN